MAHEFFEIECATTYLYTLPFNSDNYQLIIF